MIKLGPTNIRGLRIGGGYSRGGYLGAAALTSNLAPVIPPSAWRSEVTAYETRYNGYGETLSSAGKQSLQDTLDLMDTESVTLSRCYLFGRVANLPGSQGRVLEMSGAGPTADFVKDTGADSHLFVSDGMMALEGGTLGEGYLASGEAMLDNSDWTILVYASRSLLDLSFPNGASHTPSLISQYTSTAAGNYVITGGYTGGFLLNTLGGSAVTLHPASTTTNAPMAVFITYVAAEKLWSCYNAFNGALLGTSTQSAAINVAALTRLGHHQRAVQGAPRSVHFGGLFKWSGILSGSKMSAVWSGIHSIILRHANVVWSPGNSVTNNSDAAQSGDEASPIGVAAAWGHLYSRWASKNNCWYLRLGSMASRNLYHQRPASWTDDTNVAARFTVPALETAISADTAAIYRPNILLNDEHQNTGSYSASVTYADYKSIRNQIFAAVTEGSVRPTKLIQATQIANAFESYAASLASTKANKLRDFSVAIRTDPDVDVVAELYGAFNQGWDTEDDGNAPDPLNDLPNGNPAYYLWNAGANGDATHPNTAGHALMASLYQTATADAMALM